MQNIKYTLFTQERLITVLQQKHHGMQLTTDVCGRMHMFMHNLLHIYDYVRVIANIVMEILYWLGLHNGMRN